MPSAKSRKPECVRKPFGGVSRPGARAWVPGPSLDPPLTEDDAACRRRAAGYLPWNSEEAWNAVEANTAKTASDWHVMASNTPESPRHLMARARAQILHATCGGDAVCLRDLASRAARHLARMGGGDHRASFEAVRAASFDQLHEMVVSHLRPTWAQPEVARTAIPTEGIARSLLSRSHHLPEIREMLALHNSALFPVAALSPTVPRETMREIIKALDSARHVGDIEDAAETMIVRFLIVVGVPKAKARAVWDYRKKRAKRSS